MSKLKKAIESIFEQQFEDVARAKDFKEIESWDSLNYIKLVVAIQAEFGIELGPEDIRAMTCVAAIADMLRARGLQP